jgi:hypothetical protein
MKLEKTAVTYAVEVDEVEFASLLEYEQDCHVDDWLSVILRNMGCDDVEYDGHYANYIHFKVSIDDDNEEFLTEVQNVIEQCLKKAHEWKQSEESKHNWENENE